MSGFIKYNFCRKKVSFNVQIVTESNIFIKIINEHRMNTQSKIPIIYFKNVMNGTINGTMNGNGWFI